MQIKFELNNKIEIIYKEQNLVSNIQDFDDKYLIIGMPIFNGIYFPIRMNEIIDVIYYVNNDAYKFTEKIVGKKLENGIPQFILKYPKNVEKIQRREYVRIQISNDILYRKIEQTEEEIIELNKKGIMLDISGGGMKLLIHEEYNIGDKLEIETILYENKIIVCGEVIRTTKNEDNFIYVIKFDIHESIREKIIQDIFKIMRRKMGR